MTSDTRESNTPSRTRAAILDAAITVLAQRSAASLAEIADAAEVGRSTLQRHFPERSDLMAAIFQLAVHRVRAALAGAALTEGTAAQALRRAVHAYLELPPELIRVCDEAEQRGEADWLDAAFAEVEQPMLALLARARAEGLLDSSLSPEWVYKALWWNLLAGFEAVGEGLMDKEQAAESVIRQLERGLPE
ncbi:MULTISPECIES: TetR/AcrR family transcriptional regulator [unclassified Crossiella]|uniref:TetR/AcrR family transcriptional regulator n=1 Tax=unclassified Crossiella TaxID=2620835 RepID=UPI001FFF79BF|nr:MULTISPECIES: TetR family transcriptional regulator [unclassified Crossiella]MCK2244587.1 TetR/AcrR family transcriptional regulator [Crossiella sp. S99.2]MCK2258218.1 TetR/AcrR family transcriptional regulator [Crossiella sp. S99.1]